MRKIGLCHVLLGGLILTVVGSGAVLMSIPVSADDVVDDFTININVSCTLFNNVGTPHTAEVPNGTYRADIGTTTIKAYCNDTNGFSIYAIGYTGEEYGINTLVGVNNPSNTIATGTATSGQTSNWAMKLNAVSGTYTPTILNSYDSYHAVPTTFDKVATYTSATDVGTTMANASGSSLTTTYATYISYAQTADTYAGKVKYTLVHPNDEVPTQPQTTQAGRICYYPNGSNVEGTMGCQTVSTSATNATLLASNFSRAGYGFAGWSKTFDYSDDAGFLGPQEYIEFPAGTYTGNNDGLSLYARWIKSAGSLQGWSGCSSLQSGAVIALTDQRDNETYAIAKLADGNCWMIENLRLENTGTDNTNGSLAQGYGGQFAGLAEPEPAWADNITTANSLYSTDGADNTINIGTSNVAYRFPRYNNLNTPSDPTNRPQNPTSNTFTNSSTTVGMYSYGNYYTWAAAIADTTDYTTNNQSVTGTSICPTGWRLPQGGDKTRIESNDDNDFWNLTVGALNGGTNPANYDRQTRPYYTGTAEAGPVADKLRSYPNNFVYSGGVSSGLVSNRGSYGYYWSSTAISSNYAYYLYLNSSSVNPGTNRSVKYQGWPVRCVVSGV
ncbi:hypothetical protein IJG28_00010 [Candidatus Saccharibacteria bacterium]|nr:hypothetical protein [Candidatus Saccharibacteria bacterium]